MARYGQTFKDRVVARLSPPEGAPVQVAAKEVGISVSTLERLLADAKSMPVRLEAVIVTAGMNEAAKASWCRD